MATEDRGKIPAVEKLLTSKKNAIGFIQALRLFCIHAKEHYGVELFDLVSVRADLALSTPHEEIRIIEKTEKNSNHYVLTSTLIELYGAGSPLPMFYTQELIKEQAQGGSASREFIDIFNSVFYQSFFTIWKKYSLLFSLFDSPQTALWEQLFCLAGLGNASLRSTFGDPGSYITFAGLSQRPVKTAEGLRCMLLKFTGNFPLEIEQCITRKVRIPLDQLLCPGISGNVLGETTFLGKCLNDRMGAFRITIGPVESEQLFKWLPCSDAFIAFKECIKFYVDLLFAWDCKVSVKTKKLKTIRLGDRSSGLLGWNTWTFTGGMREEIANVVFRSNRVTE